MVLITQATSEGWGKPEHPWQSLRCSHTWSMEVDEGYQPKIRHLAPLDGCKCVFEEWVYGGWKVPLSHEMAQMLHVTPGLYSVYQTSNNPVSCGLGKGPWHSIGKYRDLQTKACISGHIEWLYMHIGMSLFSLPEQRSRRAIVLPSAPASTNVKFYVKVFRTSLLPNPMTDLVHV